jgi:hypothetical protein
MARTGTPNSLMVTDARRRRRVARSIVAAALSLALTACGSANLSRRPELRPPAKPQLVSISLSPPATSPSSAAAYCKLLSHSTAVIGLSTAIDTLARNPNGPGAHAAIGRAAIELQSLAARSGGESRTALLSASYALVSLDRRGLIAAAPVDTALEHLGNVLEEPCSYPVG